MTKTTVKPKAYSYVRFSSAQQAQGDSLRRQTEAAEKWAEENGYEIDPEFKLQDLGMSAFQGQNLKVGALSRFRRAVEDGIVQPGSVLIVESLDRMSRQAPIDALGPFLEIVRSGVDVYTLMDEKRYSRETMRKDGLDIMQSLMVMVRAHEESQSKSDRVSKARDWARMEAKNGRVLTSQVPAWLRVVGKGADKSIVEIPERVEILQRIFEWLTEGHGAAWIARELNEQGIKPWGRGQWWQASYIKKLSKNRAILGEYQPMRRVYDTKTDKYRKISAGAVIENYYPQVVDVTTWHKVQSLNGRGQGQRGSAQLNNVFANLAKCGRCGAAMRRVNKGGKWVYLVCARAASGAGCKYSTVRYAEAESVLVYGPLDRLVSPLLSDTAAVHAEQRRGIMQELETLRQLIETAEGAGSGGAESALMLRSRSAELETRLAELDAGRIPEGFAETAMAELHEAAHKWKATPEGRQRLNAALRRILDAIEVMQDSGGVVELVLQFREEVGGGSLWLSVN